MRRLIFGMAAALITGALSAAASGARPASPPPFAALTKERCPHVLNLPSTGQIDAIRAAMPKLVRQQLGLALSANGTSYRGWQIIGAMSLQRTFATPAPGADHWRFMAAAHCGSNVANQSWLVTLRFPNMHLINSVDRFYIALTPAGWRMWAQV